MGKLGRKRTLSKHTRWRAATQTTRCRVLGWRALHVLIIISYFWVTKTSDVNIPCAVPKYRMDEETCRYRSAHPNKCLRATAGPPQPSPLENVRHSSLDVTKGIRLEGVNCGLFSQSARVWINHGPVISEKLKIDCVKVLWIRFLNPLARRRWRPLD